MLDLQITMAGTTVRTWPVMKLTTEMKPRLRKGLRQAGKILAVQIKEHLRKYMRVTPPGREFPAFQTGALWRSIFTKPINDGGMPGQVVGPNTEYAAIHEFGGTTGRGGKTVIPKRPYVGPAWEAKGEEAIEAITKALLEGV